MQNIPVGFLNISACGG